MGDDIGSCSVTDCRLRSDSNLRGHNQQCRAAPWQKSKQTQPEPMSSPINYPAYTHPPKECSWGPPEVDKLSISREVLALGGVNQTMFGKKHFLKNFMNLSKRKAWRIWGTSKLPISTDTDCQNWPKNINLLKELAFLAELEPVKLMPHWWPHQQAQRLFPF